MYFENWKKPYMFMLKHKRLFFLLKKTRTFRNQKRGVLFSKNNYTFYIDSLIGI